MLKVFFFLFTDLAKPKVECLSFLNLLKCSDNLVILSVSNPICISVEPTSLAWVAKTLIVSFFSLSLFFYYSFYLFSIFE